MTQRFPNDVQQALVRDDMRRLETPLLTLYYPAQRAAQAQRFAAVAEHCATELRAQALVRNRWWSQKLVMVLPEVPFNNAYVMPMVAGNEPVSTVPTFFSFDFSSEMGLPPDPGYVACHELTHYVQAQQIGGFWSGFDWLFGNQFSPQAMLEPWFWEGLATHYEAKLLPGAGRPTWPVYTGMFAAARAEDGISSGMLDALGRKAHVGHHYLYGTMFVAYLAQTYGDAALWRVVASQSTAVTGLLSPLSFRAAFGKSLGTLVDEFAQWAAKKYPTRTRPPAQRVTAQLGNSARYARGRDGTEAWIVADVDAPPRLVVRDAAGQPRAAVNLVDVLPPRQLAMAAPGLVTGLAVADDGRSVYWVALDQGAVTMTSRLMRWSRGAGDVEQVADGVGPGFALAPDASEYYHAVVDGDAWHLAARDLRTGTTRRVLTVAPGQYVLTAQLASDGQQLAASVWDGARFVIWLLDAQSGAVRHVIHDGVKVYDPSFAGDGRIVHLGEVAGRFQVIVRNADGTNPQVLTDAPYAVMAPRVAGATVRFLNRQGWRWTIDEVVLAAAPVAPPGAAGPDARGPVADAAGIAAADSLAPVAGSSAPAVASVSAGATGDATSVAPAEAPVLPAGEPTAPAPDIASRAAHLGLRPATVLADRAAGVWDRFFVPQAHTLGLGANLMLNASLGGGDRLGHHRWAVTGYFQPKLSPVGAPHGGGQLVYLNSMAAPWQLFAAGTYLRWNEYHTDAKTSFADAVVDQFTQRQAVASVGRSWRDAWSVALGAEYDDERVQRDLATANSADHTALGGGTLALGYAAFESTAYTGARRGVALRLDTGYFPQALSTLGSQALDVRGSLDIVLPLPVGRRHTVWFSAVGRSAWRYRGNLLELGGVTNGATLWNQQPAASSTTATAVVPGNGRFATALRGYEDLSFVAERVWASSLAYRYPLIIDTGRITTLGLLRASFVRQLDLWSFASLGAHRAQIGVLNPNPIDAPTWHAAVGGGFTLRIAVLGIPVSLEYQIAKRVRDDLAVTQLVLMRVGE